VKRPRESSATLTRLGALVVGANDPGSSRFFLPRLREKAPAENDQDRHNPPALEARLHSVLAAQRPIYYCDYLQLG
jgi:hypothetical protein